MSGQEPGRPKRFSIIGKLTLDAVIAICRAVKCSHDGIRPRNLLCDRIKRVNTAKKYLSELENLGLLAKEKVGKEYIWFNTELMDVLSN